MQFHMAGAGVHQEEIQVQLNHQFPFWLITSLHTGAGHDAYAGAYAAAYAKDPASMAQTVAQLPPGACMLLGIEGGGQQ
jgi:hypothetical protein